MWRGTLSPRRAWQLAEYLPPDSALSASLGGVVEHRSWTLEARLLAAIFNAIRIADYANIRVNGGKGSKIGRASCRERREIRVCGRAMKKKEKKAESTLF